MNVSQAPCTKEGWLIIQKRINGDVDFNRTWEAYKNGFGDIHGEFFIGLEKLHLITQAKTYELHIQLGDINGTTSYAHYNDFEIGSEKEAYYLKSIGNYSGTAGDSLDHHKRMKFTTFDRDNDIDSGNCAADANGGWWFKNCAYR
ncbi:ficolin-1-like [Drosophila kikkawai]|uniref:Ficolin-1-like n=1 Tax=Drosophila kikkawai TaxID=30033 RepID=A0A6P4IES2_DROKI|nr:ficolin-1-like [Drosophila kikkawai]